MFYEWGCCHMLADLMCCHLAAYYPTVPWDVSLGVLLVLMYSYPPGGAFTVSVTKRLRKFTPIPVSVNVRRAGSRQCTLLRNSLNVSCY